MSDGPAPRRTWQYRAADAAGTAVSGTIDAPSERDALDALRQRALWVIDLRATDAGGTARIGSDADDWRARIARAWRAAAGDGSGAELAVLTRAVATLLEAGVPLDRALAFAASDTSRAPSHASGWAPVFAGLRDAVRAGQALAQAMTGAAPRLPASFAPMVAAAEASGTLAATFGIMADQVERDEQLRQRVRSTLVYPAVLAIASLVGTAVILVVVVPRFADLITDAGGTLPLSTRLLIGASDLLRRGGWLLLLAAVGVGAWWRASLRKPGRQRAWDATRLGWPLLGAYERRRGAGTYLGTLGVALESGVALLPAMRLARGTVANRALAERLGEAEAVVRDGGALAPALAGVLPPLAARLLEAGEGSGALATLARRAAAAADEEAERALLRVVSLIEPALILGFGGIVALVALALLQAIYGLNASAL